MAKCEQEYIILVNRADLEDGYFRFHTTYKPWWTGFIKRVGREHVEIIRESLDDAYLFAAEARVPCRYLSKATYGIKTAAAANDLKPRIQTEAQAMALVKAQAVLQARREASNG